MARMCDFCGKGTEMGNLVSHSHRKTRTSWKPNLKKVRILDKGTIKTVTLCTRCIRTGKFEKAV